MLFTDGVVEAGAHEGQCFGLARLMKAIDEEPVGVDIARRIVTRVLQHVKGQPSKDDVTVIVISREAGPAAPTTTPATLALEGQPPTPADSARCKRGIPGRLG